MKKLFVIIFIVFLLTGCGNDKTNENSNGKVTDLSKKYLSRGYIVNIYRTISTSDDSQEDIKKGNVKMTFQVLLDHYLTIDYNNKNEYIKKQIISDIKIKKSSKIGKIGDIYGNYKTEMDDFKITKTKNEYETTYKEPTMYLTQNSIAVELNEIAPVDSINFEDSLGELYNKLNITRDNVAMTITFRIKLITVDDKVLYKDYEIELPPKDFDIAGNESSISFIKKEVKDMEPYLEETVEIKK